MSKTTTTTDLQNPASTNFLTAKEAAKIIGYTSDYVGRLAREGKVSAELRGRAWFVDIDSLKLFSLQAEADKRDRLAKLKTERTRERAKAQLEERALVRTSSLETTAPLAFLQVAAVFLCGFVVFSIAYVSYDQKLDQSAFALGAIEISDVFRTVFGGDEVAPEEAVAATDEESGLVVFDKNVDEADVAAVRDSFSDEVNISFDGNDTGVITPVFKNATDEEYRFLLVPVTRANSNEENN